ncbi:hypothetical protein [Reyranella sp.]|uniref:hypothetical protein n=1 Tax=Reyranella sp. TaxID=1929291 RepID=UPI00272F05AD|nr:hypothetical protein [Reyranella sp.]MDP2377781.1 hypothetical protein [Reyranella sp.]
MDLDVIRVEVAKLEARKGDTVVVRFQGALPAEVVARATAHLEERLPEGVKVLILDRGSDLHVVRPADQGD